MKSTVDREHDVYAELRDIARTIRRVEHLLDAVGLEKLAFELDSIPTQILDCIEVLRGVSNERLDENLAHGRSMMGGLLQLAIHMGEQSEPARAQD